MISRNTDFREDSHEDAMSLLSEVIGGEVMTGAGRVIGTIEGLLVDASGRITAARVVRPTAGGGREEESLAWWRLRPARSTRIAMHSQGNPRCGARRRWVCSYHARPRRPGAPAAAAPQPDHADHLHSSAG